MDAIVNVKARRFSTGVRFYAARKAPSIMATALLHPARISRHRRRIGCVKGCGPVDAAEEIPPGRAVIRGASPN